MIQKEIKSLTGIRGIAALYVVLYHELQNFEPVKSLPVIGCFVRHGYLSVDLFFMLSGFVIMLSTHNKFSNTLSLTNYNLFLKKRFTRIYPAYFVTLVLACVFVTHFHPLSSIILSLILASIISPRNQVLPVFWSLSTEWIIYMILPFAINLTGRGSKLQLYLLLGVFFAFDGFLFVKFYGSDKILDQYIFPGAIIRGIAAYALGMCIYYTKQLTSKYYWLSDCYFMQR
ncbi:acyltransferase family protein [Mucilaginibacter agri]|uniref:Acyltransferase family protein n=1 Tax=Mucilaginibacter agri TaxID=2695265 RepID=A0A965ZDS2_9SPHI|nr:acyltransferase [Mucilaginibacter agri]NCD67821.1 acyltransferase family protein [Mucilaginibacter agri]